MTHQTMCPTPRLRIFAKANEPQASAGRSWYRIEAKAGEEGKPPSVEVLIYDEIGLWGISAARFVEDLKAVDDGAVKVTVAINSPIARSATSSVNTSGVWVTIMPFCRA